MVIRLSQIEDEAREEDVLHSKKKGWVQNLMSERRVSRTSKS